MTPTIDRIIISELTKVALIFFSHYSLIGNHLVWPILSTTFYMSEKHDTKLPAWCIQLTRDQTFDETERRPILYDWVKHLKTALRVR